MLIENPRDNVKQRTLSFFKVFIDTFRPTFMLFINKLNFNLFMFIIIVIKIIAF